MSADVTERQERGHRIGRAERATGETRISVEINLDGTGQADISTGLPFFDHMLTCLLYTSPSPRDS